MRRLAGLATQCIVLILLVGCHAAGAVPAIGPAPACEELTESAADLVLPEGASLAGQLGGFLRAWLDAQNRRDVEALRSLYVPCFDGPRQNRSASEPAWMTDRFLIGAGRQQVSIGSEPPSLQWMEPASRDGKRQDQQPWISVVVRRDTGRGGFLVRALLRLRWTPGRPQIVEQRDIWLGDWRKGDPGPGAGPAPAVVHFSCDDCPAASEQAQRVLVRACEQACERAPVSSQRVASCSLAAEALLLGRCGARRDLARGSKYAAVIGRHALAGAERIALALAKEGPEELAAALRLIGCSPANEEVLAAHCARHLFVNEYLWSSGNPKWMEQALENLDKSCPSADRADPCGSDDVYCQTAIDYIRSGKLAPPRYDRVARYRDSIENRANGRHDECDD